MLTPMTPKWPIVALAAILCCSASAWAAPEDESAKQQARVLFKEGNKLLNKKDFEGALQRFLEANKLFASYKIDLNIATTLQSLGRLDEAAAYYERFLERGGDKAPPAMVTAAQNKLGELKARLGVLKLTCAVQGAEVMVNTKAVGQTPLSRPVYLQPGEAKVVVQKDGYEQFSVTVSLAPGETKDLAAELTKVQQPEPTPEPPTDPTPAAPTDTPRPGAWKKTAGWITLAVGGATLVTGVIFSALAAAKASEHQDAVDAKKPYRVVKDLEDQNTRLKTGQIVTLVGGGIAAAAGGGLLLWYYLGSKPVAGTDQAAAVAPLLTGDAFGATVVLRY